MMLYIKNMVCARCCAAVEQAVQAAGLHTLETRLGEVSVKENHLTAAMRAALESRLSTLGFELLDDRRSRLIEQIKKLVIRLVHHTSGPPALRYSELISREALHDYAYLSRIFSETEGITIEQYIIRQKIERVKELIAYDEFSLTDIAYELGYSSVAHVSAQFKAVTGMTPTAFRKLRHKDRRALDQIGRQEG